MTRYEKALPPTDHVWRQIDKDGPLHADGTRCWIWGGMLDRGGYGRASVRGQNALLVHRFLFTSVHGAPPDGLTLDHLCRRRNCVNPDHLEAVSAGENSRRGDCGRNMREKTHCPQGHAYAGDNLIVRRTPRGGQKRECRICMRDANGRYRARLLQQVAA